MMELRFVDAENTDFHSLTARLDEYYFMLVGDVEKRYAKYNLPPELRRDEDALDLEGRFIDLLPRAAARRRTVLVCNDAAVKQIFTA